MHYDEYFIGDPASQMDDWMLQTESHNCAVAAEVSIINQFHADNICLNEATYDATAMGTYTPGYGTHPSDIGAMMDIYGVPNHTVMGATIEQLAAELQRGHGVIVGVNSSELWDDSLLNKIKQFFYDAFGLDTAEFNPADHAVVITGIDLSNPDCPMVIMNDSGIPNGAAVGYPLDQFVDAWEKSNFQYTSTSVPIPDSSYPPPSALGFDLGDFLELTTVAIIGELVNISTDYLTEVDWDSVLETV